MDTITCVDIGNQFLKFATFSQTGEILKSGFEPNTKTQETILSLSQTAPLFISDVTGITDSIESNNSILKLSISHKYPFKIEYKSPETLGLDRLCGLSGALFLAPDSDCLVFCLGTCLTIDFVGKDLIYRGGNISPGLALRYKALSIFTKKLPMVEHQNTYELTGNDTQSAILCGVQNGILAEIDYYISIYNNNFDSPSIFLTGGDRVYFENRLKSKIFAAQNLQLQGLFNIAKINGII